MSILTERKTAYERRAAEIETAINELLWNIFTDRVCGRCDAVYTERGARTSYGLQITPDELSCPAEGEPDEPTCVHADAWRELTELSAQMGEIIAEAQGW